VINPSQEAGSLTSIIVVKRQPVSDVWITGEMHLYICMETHVHYG
jgi:hypothetical protein